MSAERPRNLVFGEDAEAYDASRPGYPPGVVDLLVARRPRDAVDVGCGTGKAARLVAARGVRVVGIEPDERMAAVARRHGLEVEVTTVEAWEPRACDLLYAAQAWHWVDFAVGAERAAAAVRPGGQWAVFWNDELDGEVMATVRAVYQRTAPQLIDDRVRHVDPDLYGKVTRAIDATGGFGSVTSQDVPWTEAVEAGRFVQRLSTHSSHRLLAVEVARRLHADLLDALGGSSAALTIPYRTIVLSARRH